MEGKIRVRATEAELNRRWAAGRYALHFTPSGNLELWNDRSRKLVWQSGTAGQGAARLAMQADGNLVIYDHRARPLWASGTQGNNGAYLAVQDDGNLVVYSSGHKPIWATGTHGQ